MANSPILHLLGLARKAGRLEIGEEPVGAACRAHHTRLILLASDTAPNTRRRCAHFGETGSVLWLEIPFTKAELGFLLGRSSCAMLALTDAGFAASVVEKLAALDPERYSPAAQQLRLKADRVLQRQKEQRQHEKNFREGKRKPWAAPPVKSSDHPPHKTKVSSSESHSTRQPKPKPPGQGRSAPRARDGFSQPSRSSKSGPGGRRLSGKFRHNP